LSLPSVPHANILCGVVIRVHFIPTLLALELFALAVAVVRKATVRPRTALGCMVRLDLLHGDPLFRGFVGDVFRQASERPDVVPLRVRKPLSNVAQLLERDYVAVVFDSFRDEFVGDRVDVLFAPGFLSLPEAKQGLVCGLRAALLYLTTPLLELTTPVVVVVPLSKSAS